MTQRPAHREPGLDDPDYARFAWGRFRMMLAWSIAVGAAAGGIAIVALTQLYGPLGVVGMAAALGGIGGSVVMAGALMGLTFLSSGTGHDEAVERFDQSGARNE